MKQLPTQERILALLDYSADTGEFRWRANRTGRAKAGSLAGRVDPAGYRQISIDGSAYSAHRLAWVACHGVMPDGMQIDHINCDRSDNRIANLRLATASQNHANRRPKNGTKGATRHRTGKWQSIIRKGSLTVYLGLFPTRQDAEAAYAAAATELYGEYARTT